MDFAVSMNIVLAVALTLAVGYGVVMTILNRQVVKLQDEVEGWKNRFLKEEDSVYYVNNIMSKLRKEVDTLTDQNRRLTETMVYVANHQRSFKNLSEHTMRLIDNRLPDIDLKIAAIQGQKRTEENSNDS